MLYEIAIGVQWNCSPFSILLLRGTVPLHVIHFYFYFSFTLSFTSCLVSVFSRIPYLCFICRPTGYYLRSALVWNITQRRALKMGPIGCPETSVHNYHSTLRNIRDERRCQLHRGGSLKSREVISLCANSLFMSSPYDRLQRLFAFVNSRMMGISTVFCEHCFA
jgi:hypothetical protein